MNIKAHIEFAKLADLVENRLSAEESSPLNTHLAACSQCSDTYAKLAKTVSLMRANELEEAPPWAIARVTSLFKPRAKQAVSLFERITALLKFDSQQLMPAYGVRSAAATERQMLFAAGERELQLQLARANDEWIVSGQILGDCEGGEIEIKNSSLSKQTALNQLCEFTLPQVPAGTYSLTLRLNHIEIEVPNLDLGA